MSETVRKHPSFGMLSFSRVQGHNRSVFGSSIGQTNTIRLEIHEAEEVRSLNRSSYHQRRKLIEIEMSPAQFVEAITTMNTSGIPCTLLSVMGERKDPCPSTSSREISQKEFEHRIQKVLGHAAKMAKLAEEKLKASGPLSKADRLEIAESLYIINQEIRSNIPFAQRSFDEEVTKSLKEAKAAIEETFMSAIHRLGSEALANELEKQLEDHTLEVPQIEL